MNLPGEWGGKSTAAPQPSWGHTFLEQKSQLTPTAQRSQEQTGDWWKCIRNILPSTQETVAASSYKQP